MTNPRTTVIVLCGFCGTLRRFPELYCTGPEQRGCGGSWLWMEANHAYHRITVHGPAAPNAQDARAVVPTLPNKEKWAELTTEAGYPQRTIERETCARSSQVEAQGQADIRPLRAAEVNLSVPAPAVFCRCGARREFPLLACRACSRSWGAVDKKLKARPARADNRMPVSKPAERHAGGTLSGPAWKPEGAFRTGSNPGRPAASVGGERGDGRSRGQGLSSPAASIQRGAGPADRPGAGATVSVGPAPVTLRPNAQIGHAKGCGCYAPECWLARRMDAMEDEEEQRRILSGDCLCCGGAVASDRGRDVELCARCEAGDCGRCAGVPGKSGAAWELERQETQASAFPYVCQGCRAWGPQSPSVFQHGHGPNGEPCKFAPADQAPPIAESVVLTDEDLDILPDLRTESPVLVCQWTSPDGTPGFRACAPLLPGCVVIHRDRKTAVRLCIAAAEVIEAGGTPQ